MLFMLHKFYKIRTFYFLGKFMQLLKFHKMCVKMCELIAKALKIYCMLLCCTNSHSTIS